jgi:hypothetical protein
MRKRVHPLMILVALGILFECATVSFGQNDRKIAMVGSTEKVMADPQAVSAAKFAVSTRKEKEDGPITSIYSSLTKCQKVATDAISSTLLCGGVGGYKLQRERGDNNESITVISPNGKKYQLEFWNVISSAFSQVDEKAEWRVTRKKGKIVPVALIVRFTSSESSAGDTSKPTSLISYLAVAKITPQKICVTDKIAQSSTANEEARAAADASADKSCVKLPEAIFQQTQSGPEAPHP